MYHIVNNSRDVDLLVEKMIIENWLDDSNNLSSMINKIGIGVNSEVILLCKIPRKYTIRLIASNKYFKYRTQGIREFN